MKKVVLLIIAACALITKNVNAQCSFTPTVVPNGIVFCPNGTDTLSTQVYDTYQWYKNGKPIAGATHRTLIIHQQKDQGAFFKVSVSKDGCTDTSKHVLADGYLFNPPDIIESGDVGVTDFHLGAVIECPEDTLKLLISGGYDVNVQWYDKFKPIPGATNPLYIVTKNGSYSVCGAKDICPNYLQCESLPLNVIFENPVATITQKGDTLFASSARKYQWLFGNREIPGATQSYYVPTKSGIYKVITADKYKCTALSDGFYFQPDNKILITVSPNPVKDVLHLHVNVKDAKQLMIVDLYGNQKMKTSINGTDQNINMQNINAGTYVLQILNSSGRQISSATIIKQ